MKAKTTRDIREAALGYAGKKYKVLPLLTHKHPNKDLAGKFPLLGKSWQTQASNDTDTVEAWFKRWPDANVGIAMGKASGLVCIDVDPRNGGEAWAKANAGNLAKTPGVIEWSGRGDGGHHRFFKHPAGQHIPSCKLAAGIDLLSTGRQVVVTPSVHAITGKSYGWDSKGKTLLNPEELQELPAWIIEQIPAQRTDALKVGHLDRTISEHERGILLAQLSMMDATGGRHHSIGRWIIDAVGCGMPDEEIRTEAGDWLKAAGRGEADQPQEVENWIRDAHAGLNTGRFGVADERIASLLLLDDADPEKEDIEKAIEADNTLSQCHAWMGQLDMTEKGAIRGTRRNCLLGVESLNDFADVYAFNELSQQVVFMKPPPWSPKLKIAKDGSPKIDDDDVELAHWMTNRIRPTTEFSAQKAFEVASIVARKNAFNPVRDYLKSLKWDGFSRLDTWLSRYLGAQGDELYLKTIGSKWLISAVARTFRPGCKADSMLVIEGKQGIGKSTAINILGGRWYTDDIVANIGLKDASDQLRGRWIIEFSEIEAINRVEQAKLKGWISRTTDRFRPAYGREVKEFPRTVVFVGTTNSDEYLMDETGARRYWPALCKKIDLAAIKKDRDQLFAEAVVRYKAGETWHIDDKEAGEAAQKAQADRYVADAWESEIVKYLTNADGSRRDKVTSADVWQMALGKNTGDLDRLSQRRIGSIMTRLDYQRTPFRDENGKLIKGFRPREMYSGE